MSDMNTNTSIAYDENGLPIYDSPYQGVVHHNGSTLTEAQRMKAAAAPMPPRIAMALVKAARLCGPAGKSGEGSEDRSGYERIFSYSTIDDVISASHEALSAAGLMVYPVCINWEVVRREVNHVVSHWADYHYQFMLVWADEEKDLAETWVCTEDTRHISLPHEGGKTEGMAQSYALKHFLRGILRIKTGEVDAESVKVPKGTPPPPPQPQAQPYGRNPDYVKAETVVKKPGRPPKDPGPTYPFDFGRSADPGGNGFEQVTAEQCLVLVERMIAPLDAKHRKDWIAVNKIGLEQMCGSNKVMWRKILDALEK